MPKEPPARRRSRRWRQRVRLRTPIVMQSQLLNFTQLDAPEGAQSPFTTARPCGSLPDSLVLTECAAGQLRAYLNANELSHYHVYYCAEPDMDDLDSLLTAMGETDAAWEATPARITGGDQPRMLTYEESGAWQRPTGVLRLFRHEAVIARWYWAPAGHHERGALWLIAAPSAKAFHALRRAILSARRQRNAKQWQVIGDWGSETRPPRDGAPVPGDALFLPDPLLDRVRAEVLRFFEPAVGALYGDLGVPYRRGVLLHGPPGNGKTSLIRWIGASLGAEVSALTLRPWQGFDADDFRGVITQWSSQAPALLVLEDLDWLLQQVNVSTFLNLLDGIESPSGKAGGLMLIATTNHPEKLDPAVNNRPGRFDAVIEIAKPDVALRRRFLHAKLPALDEATLTKAVSISDGLSFAHLQEAMRLSGLRAIHAGRTGRTSEDVLSALNDVKDTHDAATRGFPSQTPEVPFGLAYLHKAARGE